MPSLKEAKHETVGIMTSEARAVNGASNIPGESLALGIDRDATNVGRSPQSWWHATLHSGKKHQASEGVCGAKPHDFFYFFLFFSCKNHLIQVKDSQ